MGHRQEKRILGPPWYYQRVSVEEQNSRLRERLRRRSLDLEYERARGHELENECEGLRLENGKLHHAQNEFYGNRSERGAKTQAIWMSLIRTCQKQGKPFIQTAAQFLKTA